MPFTNESDDKRQDYFAEGIAEDLLNLLTQVQPLRVAARTSSFSFKGKGLGIAQIAATLHVAHVLEGTVRKAGNKVRVSAQLVRASDGYQIWSQSYDRNLDDVFAIQDGIAADVVKNLKVSLLDAAPRARETDPVTYALYLQARQMRRQKTAESLQTANVLLEQALAIDPRYAPAWDQLARNIVNQMGIGVMPNNQGLGRAREATEKALAIDPNYAPAHAELGFLALYQDDLPAAAQNFQRALALDPSELGVLGSSAQLLLALDRLQSLIAVNEYLVAHDPVNTVPLQNLGYAYIYAGRYDEAIAKIGTLLSLSPGYGGAQFNIGVALLLKGDAAGALVQMQQEKAEVWRMIGLPLAYCALGRKTDADVAFAALIAKYATDSPYNIAYDYAYCGEADLAFHWLDKAVEVKDPGLYEIVAHPLFDKIHADPRWLPFLRKLGHAPEQLAKIMFTVTLPGTDAHAAETAPWLQYPSSRCRRHPTREHFLPRRTQAPQRVSRRGFLCGRRERGQVRFSSRQTLPGIAVALVGSLCGRRMLSSV